MSTAAAERAPQPRGTPPQDMFGGRPIGGLGMPTQKAKNFKGTLRRLLGYLRPHRAPLAVVIAGRRDRHGVQRASVRRFSAWRRRKSSRGSSPRPRASPAPPIDFDYVGRILLLAGVLYIIGNGFQYLMQYLMANVAQNTVYAMRQEVDAKFDRLPLKFFDSRTRGELMSRAVNDLDSISSTLQQNLTQLLTSALTLIGVIVMMLTISWILTLVIVLTLPLSIVDRGAHRKAVAEVLHAAAEGARRAERPRGGDVQRPPDHHRVRPREEVRRDVRRAERARTTTARGGRSSSAASSCR